MMKRNCNMRKRLLLIFYLLFSALMLLILTLSVLYPQNNLLPWQIGAGTLFSTIIFLSILFIWNRITGNVKHSDIESRLYWILFWGGGGLLYLVCCLHGNNHNVLDDYQVLYNSALELAEGKELSFPQYFWAYGNNVRPMLLLSLIFKLSRLAGMDEFYPTLMVSVLTVLGSVWAAGELLSGERAKKWRIPVLAVFYMCLPVYVFTGIFYTDTMSLGMGVIALAFIKVSYRKDGTACIFLLLAAFVTMAGAVWKVTSLIPLIAGLIVLILFSKWESLKKLRLYFIFLIILAVCLHIWSAQFSIVRESKEKGNPVYSWIALGMTGDGSWNAGRGFVTELNSLQTKEEKNSLIFAYMRENMREAFSVGHILSKVQRNFAAGNFGCSDCLSVYNDGTFLWELMAPWGKYYWRTSQYLFCYIGTIYSVLLVGSILSVFDLIRKREIPQMKFLTDLSFFGIVIFLMIWEANNRQLYNQLPVFLAALFANGIYILNHNRERQTAVVLRTASGVNSSDIS